MFNIDIKELIIELENTKKELVQIKKELSEIETKKQQRAEKAKSQSEVSPEDQIFNKILNSSNRRIKNQEYQDVGTINKVIKKTIIKENYSEYNFYTRFNNSIDRLTNYQTFVDDCKSYGLNHDIVAQHVTYNGVQKVHKVFQNGLIQTFGLDKVKLMSKPIFSEKELEVIQYMPQAYNPENEVMI